MFCLKYRGYKDQKMFLFCLELFGLVLQALEGFKCKGTWGGGGSGSGVLR